MIRSKSGLYPLFSLALKTALLLLALLYLIIFSASVPGWLNPFLLGLLVLLWIVLGRRQTGLELPALVFAGVMVCTAFFSIDPRRSFEQVWLISAGLCILLAAPLLVQLGLSAGRIAGLVLLVGGAAMCWSWQDAAQWYARWLEAAPGEWLPTISFRLNGSNNMAAYYNVLLMLSLGFQLARQARWQRIVLGVYSLSAALLIFLTSSRGGWVGAAAGLCVLAPAAWRSGWRILLRRSRVFWAAVAACLAAGGLAVTLYLGRMMSHPTHGAALTSRAPFWSTGWDMFLRSPLVGSGWNVYASFYMQRYSAPPGEIFLHAHNQFLDVLAGSGLLGAGALLFLLARLASVSLDAWRTASGAQKAVLTGALAACAAYLAHGIFDGLYRMPFASLSLAVTLGAALGRPGPVSRSLRSGLAMFGVGLVAFGFFNAWRLDPLVKGVRAANGGELSRAAAWMQEATRRDPNLAIAHQQLGLVYSFQAEQGEPGALEDAIAAFERAAALDPYWGLNHANLGALYLALGDLDAAENAFRSATAAAPGAAIYWLHLGEVEEARGSDQAAGQAYREALALQPELYPAGFWRETVLRTNAAETFLQEREVDAVSLVELEQRIDAGQGRAMDFIRLGAHYRRAGQLEAARRSLQKAELAYFRDGAERVELTWEWAALAAAEGRMDEAARLGGQALAAVKEPGVYGPGGRLDYAGLVFHAPGTERELAAGMARAHLSDAWEERTASLAGW